MHTAVGGHTDTVARPVRRQTTPNKDPTSDTYLRLPSPITMSNYEEAFAEEAQEEARMNENLRIDAGVNTQFHVRDDGEEEVDDDDENSPLMSPLLRRNKPIVYARARSSYERAINEPWNGAHGASGQPWYKTPSVCCLQRYGLGTTADDFRYFGYSRPLLPFAWHSVVSSFPKPISS